MPRTPEPHSAAGFRLGGLIPPAFGPLALKKGLNPLQIYIHKQSRELELVEVEETMTVEGLVGAYSQEAEATLWIEDSTDPLEGESTLADAGVTERRHVHISPCRRIEVTVRYGGDSKKRRFPPSTTIARVFEWATGKRGFALTATERAKHTLGICDTLTQPDKSEHIGSITDHRCSVCLDLAPKERFEG